MLNHLRIIGLVLSLAMLPGLAPAAILAPGDTLRVTFEMPGVPVHPNAGSLPPGHPWLVGNLLYGIINATYAGGFGPPAVRIELLDGTTSLGAFDLGFSYPFTTFAFETPGAPFNFHSAEVSSLATLFDGTIEGVLLVTNISQPVPGFADPAARFDISIGGLQTGRSDYPQQFAPFTNSPTILTSEVLRTVPEPMSGLLLGAAMLSLGLVRRVRG